MSTMNVISVTSASFLAEYQSLVYGNNQLLLQSGKTLNIVNKDEIISNSSPMEPEPEPIQQKFPIKYCPFFVEITDSTEKNAVYGYIRQQVESLLPYKHNSYYNISKDIMHIILYYYCVDKYEYDGSLDEWTKEELMGRYLPLTRIERKKKKSKSTIMFEGKSTHNNKPKNIKFGAKVFLKKLKYLSKRNNPFLLRELKISRTLSDHPSIIKLHEVLPPVDNSMILIYQCVDTNLNAIFKTNQHFTMSHVQYIIYQILLGVKYIHDANIVHRNLRPSCILINADCSIKITSFRAACGVHEKKELLHNHVGHRWYRAPETILLHHYYSHHSTATSSQYIYLMDIWAVGCIFAELLQMTKVNCSSIHQRHPLFRGDSCFPMSPAYSHHRGFMSRHDQICTIFSVIGSPEECDMQWLTDKNARKYVNNMRKEKGTLTDGILGDEASVELLKNMLKFDLKKRLHAADALWSPYFDAIRDMDLENISPPKMYSYPEIKEYHHKDTLESEEFNLLLAEEISNYIQ